MSLHTSALLLIRNFHAAADTDTAMFDPKIWFHSLLFLRLAFLSTAVEPPSHIPAPLTHSITTVHSTEHCPSTDDHHPRPAPCGLRGCKNGPALFPGWMSYNVTKPGLVSVLYLSMHYMVSLFIRAPFYVLLVFIATCAVFWLFWLSYQYLLLAK